MYEKYGLLLLHTLRMHALLHTARVYVAYLSDVTCYDVYRNQTQQNSNVRYSNNSSRHNIYSVNSLYMYVQLKTV